MDFSLLILIVACVQKQKEKERQQQQHQLVTNGKSPERSDSPASTSTATSAGTVTPPYGKLLHFVKLICIIQNILILFLHIQYLHMVIAGRLDSHPATLAPALPFTASVALTHNPVQTPDSAPPPPPPPSTLPSPSVVPERSALLSSISAFNKSNLRRVASPR